MDKIGVKFGVNRAFAALRLHSVMALGGGGIKKCLRVGVNPLGGGSYICVRLILWRII